MKNKHMLKTLVLGLVVVLMIMGTIVIYQYYLSKIPDSIQLKARTAQTIEYCVPAVGEICHEAITVGAFEQNRTQNTLPIDFTKPFTIITGECEQYQVRLKLFGFLPYKTVEINVTDTKTVVPAGIAIGIYVETDDVLVIDTGSFMNEQGRMTAPAEQILHPGDYILEVNQEPMQGKQEFIHMVEEARGEQLVMLVRRNGENFEVAVTPELNEQGEYKLGIWVRDSARGVGTLTYLDEDMHFGALGHGITDVDTGELLDLSKGELYCSQIVSIVKGITGEPGEITGMIHYVDDNILGEITQNTGNGIFGEGESMERFTLQEPMEIGYRSEVHTGSAYILSDVSGIPEYYSVEILNLDINSKDNRGIILRVTDERLIEITGGIVQGMSGSPIIQEDKLIGAVTHVLISDPTKGYGIFIENMMGMK